MAATRDFRDLEIWRNSRALRNELFRCCKSFPREEKYRLADQLIRASRSVTANIAEGYGRYHYQESIQFMRQARGSLYEMIDHLDVANACGYLNDESARSFISRIEFIARGLNAYIQYLASRKRADRAPASPR